MARLNYGETTVDKMDVLYHVDIMWPRDVFGKPGVPAPESEHRWGGYYTTAFNDKTNPNTKRDGYGSVRGNFDEVHKDVATHPSRVGPSGDVPIFRDPQAALAYAAAIEEHAEIAARFGDGGTQADRDANYLGRKVRARVVERYTRERVRIVLPTPPA